MVPTGAKSGRHLRVGVLVWEFELLVFTTASYQRCLSFVFVFLVALIFRRVALIKSDKLHVDEEDVHFGGPEDFDVFNALDVMENESFLKALGFSNAKEGRGDGRWSHAC